MTTDNLQERYMEYQMLFQQMQQLKENSSALEKHILSLNDLKDNLNNIPSIKTGTESLMAIGNGLFLKSELKDNENVIMNVGSGVCVEKSIQDAINTIDKQLIDVKNILEEINLEINDTTERIYQLQEELQK